MGWAFEKKAFQVNKGKFSQFRKLLEEKINYEMILLKSKYHSKVCIHWKTEIRLDEGWVYLNVYLEKLCYWYIKNKYSVS